MSKRRVASSTEARIDERRAVEAKKSCHEMQNLERKAGECGSVGAVQEKHWEFGEETELEIRDMLLEEFSVDLGVNGGNANNRTFKAIKLIGKLPNLALPSGWIALYHRSGGIIYLHRETRVCTWARPYHIGGASVRKHDVPAAAIPCLRQLKVLKKYGQQKQKDCGPGAVVKPVECVSKGLSITGNSNSVDTMVSSGNFHNTDEIDYPSDVAGHHSNSVSNVFDQDANRRNGDSQKDNSTMGNDSINNLNKCGDCLDVKGNHTCDNLAGPNDDISNCNHDVDDIDDEEDSDNYGNAPHDLNDNHAGHNDDISNCNHNLDDNGNEDNDDDYGDTPDNLHNNGGHIDDISCCNHDFGDRHCGNFVSIRKNINNSVCSEEGHCGVTKDSGSSGMLEALGNKSSKHEMASNTWEIDSGEIDMMSTADISDYLAKLWDFQEMTEAQWKLPLFAPKPSNEVKSVAGNKVSEILQTIPYLNEGSDADIKSKHRSFINPAGKSPQSFLHEYCIKKLKLKPTYKITESGNPKTPFVATVEIDGLQYGSGTASNKKQARHIAAEATLEILMPEMFKKLLDVDQHVEIFDNVPIEDPNVYELTSKLGLLSPYQVLKECIERNQGVLTSEIKFKMHHHLDGKIFYSIECGKHKAEGPCQNKKTGRELAAQAVLKKLHPHLKNWGSLLRIYMDKHTTTEFTKKDSSIYPSSSSVNEELLSDLKQEMWNLSKKRKASPQNSFISTKLTDIDI